MANREITVARASSKITIDASADAVWQVLGDFGAAYRYLASIINCAVEGAGIGALRVLTSADGGTIVERLETLDEATHQLSYFLLSDTPFRNALTTIALRELGPNQAELVWSVTFEADGLPASEAVDLLEGALAANCLALKRLLEE